MPKVIKLKSKAAPQSPTEAVAGRVKSLRASQLRVILCALTALRRSSTRTEMLTLVSTAAEEMRTPFYALCSELITSAPAPQRAQLREDLRL